MSKIFFKINLKFYSKVTTHNQTYEHVQLFHYNIFYIIIKISNLHSMKSEIYLLFNVLNCYIIQCVVYQQVRLFFFWAGYKFYSSTMNNSKIRQEGLGLEPSLASRNLTQRGRQGGDGNRPRPHNETLQLPLTCKLGKTLIKFQK